MICKQTRYSQTTPYFLAKKNPFRGKRSRILKIWQ
jgi:hypothetical protein